MMEQPTQPRSSVLVRLQKLDPATLDEKQLVETVQLYRPELLNYTAGERFKQITDSDDLYLRSGLRIPCIVLVGDHRCGKSSLINSLLAGLSGEYQMLAPIGTESFAGTVHFCGPYPILSRSTSSSRAKICAYLYDAEGFSPDQNRQSRLEMVKRIVLGVEEMVGKTLVNHSDASSQQKAMKTRRTTKYEGVDLVVVVASAAASDERIQEAIALERELRYQDYKSLFVLTRAEGNEEKIRRVMENHPPDWRAVENYVITKRGWENLLPDNDPAKDLMMLKVYASMLTAIESINTSEPVPPPHRLIAGFAWVQDNAWNIVKIVVLVLAALWVLFRQH